MLTIAAILCCLFALVAALVSGRHFRLLLGVGLAVFALGCLGVTLPFLLPKDFFIQHPGAENTILHPWLLSFYGFLCLVFGGGVLFGLSVRYLCQLVAPPSRRPPVA